MVIPCDARSAAVRLGKDPTPILLTIGALQDVSTTAGVQARLNNLGYHCGEPDGAIGPRTTAAVRAFQKDHKTDGLSPTGEVDAPTRNLIKQTHGC